MSQRVEHTVARGIRGRILNVLYCLRVSGGGLTLDMLRASLRPVDAVTEEELIVHLQYLQAKGYVEVEDLDVLVGLAAKRVVLLPKGIDLLERSIAADPGIINPL